MKDQSFFTASLQNLEPDNTGGAHTNILDSASRALRMHHQTPQECVISGTAIVGCVSEGKTITYTFLLAQCSMLGPWSVLQMACINELISIHGSVAEVHAHGCLL
jgi:hypothetical protein